jgi:hypothetical protein
VEVLIVLALVSLSLAAGAVLFFARGLRDRTHEHADRLALLPLDREEH